MLHWLSCVCDEQSAATSVTTYPTSSSVRRNCASMFASLRPITSLIALSIPGRFSCTCRIRASPVCAGCATSGKATADRVEPSSL